MEELHIFIHGVIGEGSNTSALIERKIVAAKAAKSIVVHINSIGGDVDEGFRIYDLLRTSGKKINAHVTGDCYSAAMCILAAAAKGDRTASPYAKFMAHRSWTSPNYVNAEIASQLADKLESIDKTYRAIVGKVLDIKAEEVRTMYENETVFDAKQALELGVITAVQTSGAVKALSKETILAAASYLTQRKETIMTNKTQALVASIVNTTLKALGVKAEGEQSQEQQQQSQEQQQNQTVQAASIGLQDGSATLYFEGDTLTDGAAVFVDEAMTTPAPDGEHILADGTIITVAGGLVTAMMTTAQALATLRGEVAALSTAKATADNQLVQAKAALEKVRLTIQNDGGKAKAQGKGKQEGSELSERDKMFAYRS